MVDIDLASLYGVPTKRLNEQVKRNRHRFPPDFMFQLSGEEVESLRSQIATSKSARGGARYRPYVFTEHGAIMLASVLNTPVAVRASVEVVRAFVRTRSIVAAVERFGRKLSELERRYDGQFRTVFRAIRQLMEHEERPRKRVGFITQRSTVVTGGARSRLRKGAA
jgi:hypothetical protein